MPFTIRPGRATDGAAVVELIRGLAEYEKLPGPDDAAAARFLEHAFGPQPRFGLLVAEVEGRVRGYALFFETYSTFRAASSLFLEDLFVHPEARRHGIGRTLMLELARIAVARGCERFEWTVLDWNESAQRFYRALGAQMLGEWLVCRVEGEALVELAKT